MLSTIEIILLSFPLIFVLLSIAFVPLLSPKIWHKFEKEILFTTSIISIIFTYSFIESSSELLYETLFHDYIPFIIMLFTLFTLSCGIHIKIDANSSTFNNIIFLSICSLFASFIGTTGASMLFIRPFLKMNEDRIYKSHLVIFFIFLVSNIGGLLTPLGDPPLLLGYLHGIEFSWFIRSLSPGWFIYIISCLSVLYIIDSIILRKERKIFDNNHGFKCSIKGIHNIILILFTVFIVFTNSEYSLFLFNFEISFSTIKNIILLSFCLISFIKSKNNKEHIDFSPFSEVARTFLVIFIVIAPVIFILNENSEDIHHFIVDLSKGHSISNIYFWMCGMASSFLDNAPSYLLFFNIAGGNPQELMYVQKDILVAISISSVVMGSMTYIGNAPNMMVRSISEKKGIKMPSFIGYIMWSALIILPISIIINIFIIQ